MLVFFVPCSVWYETDMLIANFGTLSDIHGEDDNVADEVATSW